MNNSFYDTKDLAEASYLLTKGVPLEKMKKDGKVCWFTFKDKTICEQLTQEYWFNNGTVVAREFFNSLQTIKNRIFSIM